MEKTKTRYIISSWGIAYKKHMQAYDRFSFDVGATVNAYISTLGGGVFGYTPYIGVSFYSDFFYCVWPNSIAGRQNFEFY